MNYREALEFIGEVRAGISWERFCMHAVRHSDVFIDILNDTEESRQYLSSRAITREYVTGEIMKILRRLHFNEDNDHYLTLALPGSASETQIHKRWKELMLLYHPDRNRDADAASCAARINESYSGIKSAERRMEYDRKRLEAHRLHREVRRFRTPPREKYAIGSPKMRSILSKLIIPLCVIIAGVILLVIFLENREKSYVGQAAVTDKEDSRQQTQPGVPGPQQAAVAENVQAEKASPQEASSSGVPAGKSAPEKEQPPSLSSAKATDSAAVRTDVPRKEQKTVAQPVPVPEKKRLASPERTVTASAEAKKTGYRAEDKKDGEKRVVNNREITAEKPADKLRETPIEKVVKPATVQEVRGSAKAEAGNTDRSVNLFIGQYTRAYEEGDIEKFMSLFSKAAMENDRMNFDEIRRAYKQSFENNRYRYNLRNVNLRKTGDDVIVTGFYVIKKVPDAGGEVFAQGDIRWILTREGEALKIVKVDY